MTRVATLLNSLLTDPSNSIRHPSEFSTEANYELVISLLVYGYDPYRFQPIKVRNIGSFDYPRYRVVDGLLRYHFMQTLNGRLKNAGKPIAFEALTVEVIE